MQRVVKLFSLPTRDGKKDSITALDCKGNVVYIGTGSGLLQKWRLDQDSTQQDYVSRQLKQVPLKKKPVLQLVADPEWPRLFCLCDENVTVHNSEELSREFYITEGDGKTAPLKGCTCLAVAPVHKGTHRVCVATKRKLHLYTYKLSEGTHTLFQVLVMPSSVCCIAFQGETLCCGYTKEYSLLNCYSGEATGLFTLSNQTPYIKSLCGDQAALCNIGNRSIRVSLKENDIKTASAGTTRITRETIRWSSEPKAIGFKHPYIVGLLADKVEVYSMYDGEIVQVLTNLSGAILASVRNPSPIDNLCICTDKDVYMLVSASVEVQIKTLLHKLMTTEAFDLLYRNRTGDEEVDQERMKQTHIDAGFAFLFRGQPSSAFEHFTAADIDVREVLVHFPELLPSNATQPGGVLYGWQSEVPSNDASVTMEVRYSSLLQGLPQQVPRTEASTALSSSPIPTPTNGHSSHHGAASAPVGSQSGSMGEDTILDNGGTSSSLSSIPRMSTDGPRTSVTAASPTMTGNGVEFNSSFAGSVSKMMSETIDMLLLFIVARRESAGHVQQRCIDYASLVVYVTRGDTERTYDLLTHPNYCHLSECSSKLKELRLYRELALLYFDKNDFDAAAEAIDLADPIRAFSPPGEPAPPPRSGKVEHLQKDLQEIFFAVESRNPTYLRRVISRGADVNATDSMGNTALHYAAAIPCPQEVQSKDRFFGSAEQLPLLGVLLNNNADPDIKNSYSISPLDVALQSSTRIWGLMRAVREMQDIMDSVTEVFSNNPGGDR